tara:strand:+ start:621126 stop:622553 length:1428 start_codon:yes stop_codon:yes gene_type:complete
MAPSDARKKSSRSSKDDSLSVASVIDALGSIRMPDDEVQRLLESLSRPHHSVLRFRREVDPGQFALKTEPVDWYSLARRTVFADARPSRQLSYFAGDYYLQDAGSLLALAASGADTTLGPDDSDSLADDGDGPLVCDLCAAPGGKATALLEAFASPGPLQQGFLLANEPIRSRIAPLSYNLARCGSDRYAISSLDPDELADRLGGVFDLVVVDAPCSGQALLSKGKQSTSALSSRQIEHSAARQSRILDAATRLLREGGRLIYSTCTFAEAENESQMIRLVDRHDYKPVPVSHLNAYASDVFSGCYRLWPHRHACAGSFAASFRATRGGDVPRRWKGRKPSRPPVDLQPWFQFADDSPRFFSLGSVFLQWPHDAPDWVEDVTAGGPELSHRTGQTWKPAHGAALRRGDTSIARQRIDVDAETAVAYLQGNPIPCPASGWTVVCYAGRPLGWVKSSSGVGKNQLFPAARVSGAVAR